MQAGFIHLSVGRARGLRTDRGQLLNCVPGSVNTRPSPLVLPGTALKAAEEEEEEAFGAAGNA